MGDGEMDEPESLGAISLAGRERLDNLVFVINCNLQRLDGPVRGNGKIINELETVFRGAGWNVLKVIWGNKWDALLKADHDGLLKRRMDECVDGEYQTFKSRDGAYVREHFFGAYPELAKRVEDWSDDEIWALSRGGHDPNKVYAAYHEAVNTKGMPTVILAKTVKGYGMGSSGESSGGLKKSFFSICSSVSSSPKRSRNAYSASSVIFFCWWVMFWPSPASPIPYPLTVLARITVGLPVEFTASW